MVGSVCLTELRRRGLCKLLKDAKSSSSKRIVIDYSSPNIAKRFHIGNLRSTLIGRFTAKINESIGHSVHSINYLGDWGRQMALIIAYWPTMRPSQSYWNDISDSERVRLLTDCYIVGSRAMEDDIELKVRVRELHKKMEMIMMKSGRDSEELKEWKDIVDISSKHLQHFYSLFNCSFNKWLYESEESNRARSIVQSLLDKNIAIQDDEGVIIPHSKDEFYRIGRSDNTTLYLTRDISSLLYRDELFKGDEYIYVVERAQRNHFIALKRIMELIGREDLSEKIKHLSYGRVKGLSTRKGRTEAVEEIMHSGQELAIEWMKSSPTRKELAKEEEEETASKLAVSSLIVSEMRRARNSDYEFSWRRTFDPSGGNNALFLNSKYSRLCSIEETNRDLMNKIDNETQIIEEEAARPLISSLINVYSKSIESSISNESHELTNSLLNLARECGKAGVTLRVKGEHDNISISRLCLLNLCKNVLSDGMNILGIDPIQKM